MSDTKLLSYAEIAGLLGIGGNSARALVRRKRWHRKPGNDGLARIEVPIEYLAEHAKVAPAEGDDSTPSSSPASIPSSTPSEGGVIEAFERHINRLEGELAALKQEHDAARRDLLAAQAEAVSVPALRDTVAALKGALESEKARVADMRAERDRLAARRSWWPFRRAG
ncbi:MAG: hypothetical protein ACJ8BC_10185 [Gemmatimonadales bacterium]